MDQAEAPIDIQKQWQEARANRRMQFQVGNYRDGDRESNVHMLTGTIKADWIQLPVERYLAALPTLRQAVIGGVFRNKGAAPWTITRAEKLQLSVFLPNDLSLDDWYAEVYALPTVWPDVSMLGADNLRKVVGHDFHHQERLFTNSSNRPGDDMKDELRTDGDPVAWQAWSTSQHQVWQLRQPAPP